MPTDSSQSDTDVKQAWTTARLLTWMTGFLQSKGVDSPRLTGELLLAHVLNCERLRLYMEADRPASSGERDTLRELVRRVALHEPVQYVLGEGWFYGRPFFVDRSTLIPRPSTETVVEHVIRWARRRDSASPLRILDVGSGTGCIAITLARELPHALLTGTDIEPTTLALAQRNAFRHDVSDRTDWREGNLLEPVAGMTWDAIVSNPPYIPDSEWNDVAANVCDHEPERALRGGPDGLSLVRPLIAQVAGSLQSGGLLAIEIAHASHDAVVELGGATGAFDRTEVLKDGEGLWRVLRAERR